MSKKTLDSLINIGSKKDPTTIDSICSIVEEINISSENDLEKLKKAFEICQFAIATQEDQLVDLEKAFERQIKDLKRQLDNNSKGGSRDGREREYENEIRELESKNDELNKEIKELESKYFEEQRDKDSLALKLEEMEKSLSKVKKDNLRLEDDIKDYTRQIQSMRNEKTSKTSDDSSEAREKIRQKNKLIAELEDENIRLIDENAKLEAYLQENKRELEDATQKMIRTTRDIEKFRALQLQSDSQLDQYVKENELLKTQVATFSQQLMSRQNQESSILITIEERIKEYKEILQDKDNEIAKLQDLCIELEDQIKRFRMDSDKSLVANMLKAIQQKDKEIEVLKEKIEDCAKEMDKSSAVINNLSKTAQQGVQNGYAKNTPAYLLRDAEQKVKFLENMLKENQDRLRECEEHTIKKEKELLEAQNALDVYESGDYQLQQAVTEIKNLKVQLKIRDCDIENLTKHINKLDYKLNEILEEEDELRAKLGLDPRGPIDLDGIKELKVVKAQESRAIVHVLKKEIENLEEDRIKLKEQIRKYAKLAGKKDIDSLLEEEEEEEKKSLNNKASDKKKEYGTKHDDLTSKISKETLIEIDELRRKNQSLLKLHQECSNENRQLEEGLREVHGQLQIMKVKVSKDKGEHAVKLQCPTLDKLLQVMESNNFSRTKLRQLDLFNRTSGVHDENINQNVLLSEIDYLQGRNEELRLQLNEARKENTRAQFDLTRVQDENEKLNANLKTIRQSGITSDSIQTLKLPNGIAPSSKDIISTLNEYLIDTLQEIDEYKSINVTIERDLERLKRKNAVQRSQLSLLYRDHLEEVNKLKAENTSIRTECSKLNDQIQVDAVKLQEFQHLLNTLEKDEVEVRRILAESTRQMYVVRSNEKQLERKCAALEDLEIKLVKENKRLRTDIIQMEVAVQQRLGYLERYREMSNFKLTNLQKKLDECVPQSKIDELNKNYDELVSNYRQLLDKQDVFETKSEELHEIDGINKKYAHEIEFLRKTLESEKEKVLLLEQNMDRLKYLTDVPVRDLKQTAKTHEEALTKRLIAIEMKELNEKQRADHAQKMYDEQRRVLRTLENRNLELEENYAKLSKLYLNLQKTEQKLREDLSTSVSKAINEADKTRISELQETENTLKLEVARLRELTDITLYQTESIEFINNLNRKEMDILGSIEVLSTDDNKTEVGKLHRQLISLQISEATAIRKLQNAQQKLKQVETQLIRTEQKLDKETQDHFMTKKEYSSKIFYLRSIVQDLRHKYSGSIPLKQQEKYIQTKQQLVESKKQLTLKLQQIDNEKIELEDRIGEYETKLKSLNELQVMSKGVDAQKLNERLLEWHKKVENHRIHNLKLERANKRFKEEIKFMEELNRKHEITINTLEEENIRMERDFDQRLLIWEHREADLERSIEHLKQQHKHIEDLAFTFEEISGQMPDRNQSIPNQLDQAMSIIREHVKLLAEAKIQSEFSKKRIGELNEKVRKAEHDVCLRDRAIAELRLRLPATIDRDNFIEASLNGHSKDTLTPTKAAQSTIESLQTRLNQKDQTIIKYQEMLKLSREEITKINKQHELELNNLFEKLNSTRDTNLQQLKENLRYSPKSERIATKTELQRLIELEEVTVEQDNTISALNEKITQMQLEIQTWRSRHELLIEKFTKEKENLQKEQEKSMDKINVQINEFKTRLKEKNDELQALITELEDQKQLNTKSPSNTMRALVEKLKHQLQEKEQQQQILTKAMSEIRKDMVSITKNTLVSAADEQQQMTQLMDKRLAELQDKNNSFEEELIKLRKELKLRSKTNEDLSLEIEHLTTQLKLKDDKLKKYTNENYKLMDDAKRLTSDKFLMANGGDKKQQDITEHLKGQIRILEDKLRRQRPAEKPYESNNLTSMQKQREKVATLQEEILALKEELKYSKMKLSQSSITKDEHSNNQDSFNYQKYQYILNENTLLKRDKHDLEIKVMSLNRDYGQAVKNLTTENEILKKELNNSKAQQVVTQKLDKLTSENLELKKKIKSLSESSPQQTKSKLEDLQKYVQFLKNENETLKNTNNQQQHNDSSSSSTTTCSSTSNLRKIGESGKSTRELEKTISLMKKIIVKLQQENEMLKSNSTIE